MSNYDPHPTAQGALSPIIEKQKRFRGNNKGVSLTVVGNSKFKRVIQRVNGKTIYHYL